SGCDLPHRSAPASPQPRYPDAAGSREGAAYAEHPDWPPPFVVRAADIMLGARARAGFVAAAAVIISWQLFLPPIVGLADQGDFARVIGLFGFGAQDKTTEYAFVARKYVPDPN